MFYEVKLREAAKPDSSTGSVVCRFRGCNPHGVERRKDHRLVILGGRK